MRVRLGRDLFAGWCKGGVRELGIRPVVSEEWPVERGTMTVTELPRAGEVGRATLQRLQIFTGTPVVEHTRTGYTGGNRAVRVMVSIIPGHTLILRYTAHLTVTASRKGVLAGRWIGTPAYLQIDYRTKILSGIAPGDWDAIHERYLTL